MRSMRRSVIPAATIALAAGCATQTSEAPGIDTAAIVAAVTAAQDREVALISAGHIDSMLTIYTDDVHLMAPNEPARHGAAEVRTWVEAVAQQVSMTGRYTSTQIDVASNDFAIARYVGELTATPRAGGAATTEKIKG
ncbi:MAG TPA: nuclear transport factor 2 family protein, partial [bacterium]|nr:nuclear transport factor 2 family protein [bacterium]